ncbi:hypothetical protein C3497_04185 [Zoogloeaceae bacteirum Par-f-2]|nr:hypothetical protein C3497_04185 [Zoogloeaceae bacteirum Par-f-2]
MKIAAASLQMQAEHLSSMRFESFERLTAWVGERPTGARAEPAPATAQVQLSAQALAAQAAEATQDADEADQHDPQLQLLVRMIEYFTGRPIRLFDVAEFNRERARVQADAAGSSEHPMATANGPARAGFGIEYDYSASYTEREQLMFQASGTVRTADGREIAFTVSFEMERRYAETQNISFRAGDARLKDPLVFDFGGPGSALSDLRFSFDLDADGRADEVPLPAGGRGFLAFDRNDNGRIDDGSELFGPQTGDGFAELAALDHDGNGWIDENDPAFGRLRVWQPAAEGNGQVHTLTTAGVGALYLGRVTTPFDLRGSAQDTLGMMRSTGIYLREDGSAGTLSQIDLSV